MFLDRLRKTFPHLRRVRVSRSKGGPDLEQDGVGGLPTVNIVATRDTRGAALVTMSVDDFLRLQNGTTWFVRVRVQVKYRKQSWIGTLYRELRAVPQGRA
jgi:hypothetical protein